MKNKSNVIFVAGRNFYVLKENPTHISYKEIKGEDSSKWINIKLKIIEDNKYNILPNNNEIMYYYNDIQSIILIKEEIKNM